MNHNNTLPMGTRITNDPCYSNITDDDLEYFKGFCECVGFVVLYWAIIEQHLDTFVNVCFNNCGGSQFQSGHGVPKALKRKLTFLRKCFKEILDLSEFRDEGLTLLSRVSSLSNRRHDLIHGAITEAIPDPIMRALRFRRIGYDGDKHTVSEYEITPSDFQELSPILADLVADELTFAQKLANKFLASR